MALTFLDLTNAVLNDLNEVQLDSMTFTSASGFHNTAKRAVNSALFDIYTFEDTEWPFLWTQTTFNTVIGQVDYTKNASAVAINWDSFALKPNNPVVDEYSHKPLDLIDWDTYIKHYRSTDLNTDSLSYSCPDFVVRRLDNNITLASGVPDKAYTISYEYFFVPTKLSAAADTTPIPEAFEQVITDKALQYAYMFRDNMEQSALSEKRYEDNIWKMRRILIPQTQYARFLV